jgi:hypothetical protein
MSRPARRDIEEMSAEQFFRVISITRITNYGCFYRNRNGATSCSRVQRYQFILFIKLHPPDRPDRKAGSLSSSRPARGDIEELSAKQFLRVISIKRVTNYGYFYRNRNGSTNCNRMHEYHFTFW